MGVVSCQRNDSLKPRTVALEEVYYLYPIKIMLPPAPENVLHVILCSCKEDCRQIVIVENILNEENNSEIQDFKKFHICSNILWNIFHQLFIWYSYQFLCTTVY